MNTSFTRGVTTMLVVAFMGIFTLILGTITSYAFEQAKYGRALYGREQALHIAESGLEYYRWFLAHYPNNLTNGTGLPGPYSYTVSDPEGSSIGTASISVSASAQCGVNQWIDITSRGASTLNPTYARTLFARYMQPSVATYSYLLNTNVWAGSDRNITGQYFSNGGIRMDGTSNSDVSSAVSTWSCDSGFGCSPTQTKNGVWGGGSGSSLWKYPVASIDFAAISVQLGNLKTYTRNNGGIYYAAASGGVDSRGYHLVFNSNGTVTIYRVTSTIGVPSYSESYGWRTPYISGYVAEYSIINNETLLGTYSIPSSCGVIFVEDRAWIEGTVKGKVTVAAATPSDSATTPDVYLRGSILYSTSDGSDGLTVIAEGGIFIPLTVPNTMEIHGIFVAQSKAFERPFYTNDSAYGSQLMVGTVNSSYPQYVTRTQLTTAGTVVSYLRTGTSWTSGGVTASGFLSRIDAYDQLQATNPPPFTPPASTDYSFVLWREQ